jgi:AcrR family transcriptional regulator
MATAAERLHQALATLAQPQRRGASPLTVAALCRAAGVSRNSLYRYHPEILEALHAQRRGPRAGVVLDPSGEIQRLRAECACLRAQIPKLAALIDHYYAAATELRALLERRDRELAELRRRLDERPVRLSR